MTYSSNERICGTDSTALCVIAFLDNEDKTYIKNKEEILDKIRKSPTLRVNHSNLYLLFMTCLYAFVNTLASVYLLTQQCHCSRFGLPNRHVSARGHGDNAP